MSNTTPVNPQPRELEIIQVLFDRHLSNRAVALAESRWPGSGAMIRLAYDWSELSPEARREKISEIGPEDLTRLKNLAALNPELEKVINDLDNRGVLPHLEEAALAGTAAAVAGTAERQEPPDLTFGAPIADPVADEESPQPPPAPDFEPDATTGSPVSERLQQVEEIVEEYDLEHFSFEDLKVNMPDLDSGLPSTGEVLAERETHRQEAVARADAAMERVRHQLDQTASRVSPSPESPISDVSSAAELSAIAPLPEQDDLAPIQFQPEPEPMESDELRLTSPPDWLVGQTARNIVTVVTADRPTPTADEMVALANQLDLELAEFTVVLGETRAVYGGLIRAGSRVDVSVGPLPLAMASGALVVIHGRLFQRSIDRFSSGFCDLPGTRATVRLHEDTRVLILPN